MSREQGGRWAVLCAALFYPLVALLGARRFEGREHIPMHGPALLVANHISYLDPVYTAVFVHSAGRIPRFLAKASLWRIPVLRRALDATAQVPVYRGSGRAGNSLHAAADSLAAGRTVVIYPEGTVTRDPQAWPMAAKTGVARLASTAGVPVIPVVHWGTHEIYDHYAKRFRPLPRRRVVVAAGPPLDLSGYQGHELDSDGLRAATDLIMGEVRELLAEMRGVTPPESFDVPGGQS